MLICKPELTYAMRRCSVASLFRRAFDTDTGLPELVTVNISLYFTKKCHDL